MMKITVVTPMQFMCRCLPKMTILGIDFSGILQLAPVNMGTDGRRTCSNECGPQPQSGSVEAGEVNEAMFPGEDCPLEQHGQQVPARAAVGQAAARLGQNVARRMQHRSQLLPCHLIVARRNSPARLQCFCFLTAPNFRFQGFDYLWVDPDVIISRQAIS